MKTYTIKVSDEGSIHWYKEGTEIRHCEHGPAREWANGENSWYLDDEYYLEQEFNKEMERRNNPISCEGKVVEVEGKKYKLTEI